MHPLQESWDRTTAHLGAARDLLHLDAATHRDVSEYLDHNELGLAFDVLVDACKQAEHAEPVRRLVIIGAAVDEMQIRPEDPVHGVSVREVLRHRRLLAPMPVDDGWAHSSWQFRALSAADECIH